MINENVPEENFGGDENMLHLDGCWLHGCMSFKKT